MAITSEARELLEEVLEQLYADTPGTFPLVREFRLAHEDKRGVIDELVANGYLRLQLEQYYLTRKGLFACRSATRKRAVEEFDALLPGLKDAYRNQPGFLWSIVELASHLERPPAQLAKTLTLFAELLSDQRWWPATNGLVHQLQLAESVLDIAPLRWGERDETSGAASSVNDNFPTQVVGKATEVTSIDAAAYTDAADLPSEPTGVEGTKAEIPARIASIELTGYRPFSGFSAQPGDLTVVIGANASGKSSLFDFLRFMSFAASNPLPPEIDPRSVGKRLFHTNGPERIELALVVEHGGEKPLRYEVEIQGPIGAPRVVREQLATIESLSSDEHEPFVFLSFKNGRGVVRDQVERKLRRPEWTVLPNELALRRALDPTLITLSRFQTFVTAWRFYSGFDVSTTAIRRPVPSEPSPTLAEDGSNLSAVLFSLRSEHPAAWGELETQLRSAIPGFGSLEVKPRGGPGTVMGVWREDGIKDELTLADLSDGTLRFLCWATLCLSPAIPPLICIDEPELGLHPRVLPVLAGVLRMASARSQILVATHSPYFLGQFQLDEIAVMKKEAGKAVFKRPATSESLRREIEELGSDALALMHISDELEARS